MKLALGLAPGSYDGAFLETLVERLRGMVASRDARIARMGEEGAGKAALIARQEAETARLLEENASKDKQVNGLKEENAKLKRTNSALNAKILGIKSKKKGRKKGRRGKRRGSDEDGFGQEEKPKSPPTTRKTREPDERLLADQKKCPECKKSLSKNVGSYKRKIERMAGGKMRVIEYKVLRRYCRTCKKMPPVSIDGVLRKERFGTDVMARAGAVKQMGITFEQVKGIFKLFADTDIARSTLVHFYDVSAKALLPTYEQLRIELVNSANVHGDETRWYINGKPVWLWVFRGESVTIFEIDESRSREVALFNLGDLEHPLYESELCGSCPETAVRK